MDHLSHTQLEQLGTMMRAVTERSMEPGAASSEARRQFLGSIRDTAPRRGRRTLGWALAATACAAVVVALVVLTSGGPPPTTFAVGEPPISSKVGEWIAAGVSPVPVRFSDGSSLELEPGTRLRVTATTAEGADVLIESGTLHASIEHRAAATRWMVHAGPFEVQVTGTRFDASWDPGAETFRVAVKQGAVAVSGPQLPPGRAVVEGEFLFVAVRRNHMALGKGDGLGTTQGNEEGASCDGGVARATDAAAPDATGQEASVKGAEPASDDQDEGSSTEHGAAGASATGGGAGGRTSGPSWRELARTRKFREAWATIEQVGFEQELGRAGASDLLAMADVARFAGQPSRAKQALMKLRERFGASGQSAFLLGRLAADQLGAAGEAVIWFETYLQEAPNGPLAEQALGRVLDLQRRGAPERARAVAERYLARYPNGAYAAVARSVLQP